MEKNDKDVEMVQNIIKAAELIREHARDSDFVEDSEAL